MNIADYYLNPSNPGVWKPPDPAVAGIGRPALRRIRLFDSPFWVQQNMWSRTWTGASLSAITILGFLCLGFVSLPLLRAEEPGKAEEKKPPRIVLSLPLGLVKGETNKVILRGLNLESVEKLSTLPANGDVRSALKGSGKSDPPKDLKREEVGDTHLDVEVYLSEEFEGRELTFQAEDGKGSMTKWTAPIFEGNVLLLERGENNQLSHPQKISTGAVVFGSVEAAMDVDVYEFYAAAGRPLVLEVRAARLGSALDPLLMVYDERGNLLKSDDDSGGRRDARLAWSPSAGGNYRVAVLDASDKGSPMHAYVLIVEAGREVQP